MVQKPLMIEGRVTAVLVGDQPKMSTRRDKIALYVGEGVKGDRHFGRRLADAREEDLIAIGLHKGIEVANVRQLSIVSTEELAEISSALKLAELIPPGVLGENLVISGIPRLTQLPPGTKLFFRKGADIVRTAVVAIWAENTPCIDPGQVLAEQIADPGVALRFVKAAMGRRGLVGFVYSSGFIAEGDAVIAHVPAQKIYQP